MAERRDHERHLIRRFALLKLANGELIEGETQDMSVGGAFIECAPERDVNEGDICTITLILEDDDESISTEIYGSISHRAEEGIGCNFLKINSAYYQFMSEYLE
jgi:hypothetical protein